MELQTRSTLCVPVQGRRAFFHRKHFHSLHPGESLCNDLWWRCLYSCNTKYIFKYEMILPSNVTSLNVHVYH